MSTNLKNGLIKAFCYLLSISGMAVIIIFQYFNSDANEMPTWIKATVPALLALLIFFLVYYKSIKQKIARKLTAIETATELGQTAQTGSVVANLLETIGIVVPLVLIAAIFVIGGEYLVKIGTILFEILGMYLIIVIGNIICDENTRAENTAKELEKAEEMASKIADKISDKYE